MIDYIGYLAGLLVTFSLMPQILRIYKLKSAHEISILYNTSLLVGVILWLIYGMILGLIPLIVWNAIGMIFVCLLLLAKMRYGR